jgi:hypothetical protein
VAIQAGGGGQFKLVQRVYEGGARIWCTPNVSPTRPGAPVVHPPLLNFLVKLIVFSCCSVGAIGVHGSGVPPGEGSTDPVHPWVRGARIWCFPGAPQMPFFFRTLKIVFFCSGQDCCEKFKGVEIYWGGDPQEKQSAVGFRESYSFQIVRNIIYNACALLVESSIASCSFVFSIACVDELLTVSVLDHK